MIKKTIKYIDFNSREVVKDYYFHLTKVDMVEVSLDGTFEEKIRRAVATQDKLTIFEEFKRLIAKSVGMRTEDGSGFVRTEDFTNQFLSSPAFDELIMELFTSEDQGTEFIKGLLPPNMQEDIDKELKKRAETVNLPEPARDPFADDPAWYIEKRKPTQSEFRAATPEQQKQAMAWILNSEKS